MDTNSFFQWFDAASAAASASAAGALLMPAGFQPEHMGGGTLSWVLDQTPHLRAMITVSDDEPLGETSNELGQNVAEPESAVWYAGIYPLDNDGCFDLGEKFAEVKGLSAAIDWCRSTLATEADYYVIAPG